jgi:nitrite reductase/ring-hydroxylating ferredoxin subunit
MDLNKYINDTDINQDEDFYTVNDDQQDFHYNNQQEYQDEENDDDDIHNDEDNNNNNPSLIIQEQISSPGMIMNGKLMFPTTIHFDDLIDMQQHPPIMHKKFTVTGVIRNVRERRAIPIGPIVKVNEIDVLLTRYQDHVIAFEPLCPHAKGDLSLGDIEEIGLSSGLFCITCPLHSWKFNATVGCGEVLNHPPLAVTQTTTSTSKSMEQQLLQEPKLKVYPTIVDDYGYIFVGFDTINEAYFAAPDF